MFSILLNIRLVCHLSKVVINYHYLLFQKLLFPGFFKHFAIRSNYFKSISYIRLWLSLQYIFWLDSSSANYFYLKIIKNLFKKKFIPDWNYYKYQLRPLIKLQHVCHIFINLRIKNISKNKFTFKLECLMYHI